MIHMKVKPFLHVNHNVWFLFIVVFLNESRETAWEMYLPLLCHWGWKRRHEWTQDLYFCANNSKKWGPELVKRGPERTQDLYFGLYSEKGRSWVCEKSSWGSLTFWNYSTKSLLFFCTTGSNVSGGPGRPSHDPLGDGKDEALTYDPKNKHYEYPHYWLKTLQLLKLSNLSLIWFIFVLKGAIVKDLPFGKSVWVLSWL